MLQVYLFCISCSFFGPASLSGEGRFSPVFTLYVLTCLYVACSLFQSSLQLVLWFQVATQWEAVQFLGMSSKELALFSIISKMFHQKLCNLLQGRDFVFYTCVVCSIFGFASVFGMFWKLLVQFSWAWKVLEKEKFFNCRWKSLGFCLGWGKLQNILKWIGCWLHYFE